MEPHTPKQRMLNAYRGQWSDRRPIAPEFWYYYPARLLGVDMIEFRRSVPFHLALKTAFAKFGCEGWGIVTCDLPDPDVEWHREEMWANADTLLKRATVRTPKGTLTCGSRHDRHEPSWTTERFIKEFDRDLPAFEYLTLTTNPELIEVDDIIAAWTEVGESYLLEAYLGTPFSDYFGEAREGGLEQAVLDLIDRQDRLKDLQTRYIDRQVRLTRAVCENTPLESLFIGCTWSCNSLIGPNLWRKWDKPVIAAIADEVHRHGRLLHVHFHGRCMDTVPDFAEIGIDCVCPFERPPGGDVVGLEGLKTVAGLLQGRTTMNGNIHTVEALIRGTPDDVRREVCEVLEAFQGNPRLIIGTGDQVGRETPEENLYAMIDEARKAGQ